MAKREQDLQQKVAARLVCVRDYELHAAQVLPKQALDYYKSGAGEEFSLRRNRDAFFSIKLRPRCLRDVTSRSLTCKVLGRTRALPLGVAPTAMQRMAHPEGEVASARAAARIGGVFVLSTLSTSTIEEVAEATPSGCNWFQLYIYRDREVTRQLVQRAERAGFSALVLTVDAPLFGNRRADTRNNFSLPPHLSLANFVGITRSDVTSGENGGSGINEYVASLFDQTLTWRDLAWLKSVTSLPLVVKGILTPEDAVLAVDHGVSAVLVSNHGARQIDTVPATIEVLPSIVKAVAGRCEVFMDGGVMQGTDVFKAVALGASMVFVGRPVLWGLTHSGEEGVKNVLSIIRDELDLTMALTGCTSIEEIKKEYIDASRPIESCKL